MNRVSPSITAESLATALMESHACDSSEEATAIAHSIFQDANERSNTPGDNALNLVMIESLQDYFGLEADEAKVILRKADTASENVNDDDRSESSLDEEEETNTNDIDNDNVSDDEWIGEGECELCERMVQLTKHHLIPKSTHARMEPKLLHAATAIQKDDLEKARVILGPGLEHVLESMPESLSQEDNATSNNRMMVKRILTKTCNICRPCHSAVHDTHDNTTLALNYNTVEQLLEDPSIYKFCAWAHKQKAGKYAVMRK